MKLNKINLSGVSYDIEDLNAAKTVELTQAQYDALAVKDPNTFYIIVDAEPVDMSDYYTKDEVDDEITAATSGKQDTLVSGTNIKTVNNESLLGSGNITIEGSSVTVDSAIDTGSTNPVQNAVIAVNTIKSFGVASTNNYDIVTGYNFRGSELNNAKFYVAKINGKHFLQQYPSVGNFSLVETSAITSSVTSASTDSQVPSAKAVYDALQESGGGTVDTELDSTSENPVQNKVIYQKFDEVEEVTAAALNALNDKIGDINTLLEGI